MKFKNKIVVVTGSGRGIGKATALAFAREGASVIVNYIANKEAAEKVVADIKVMGGKAVAVRADVSNEDEIKKMIEQTVGQFGGIDILVNNAGIVFDIPILEKTVEQWLQTLRVNLIGTFLCSKYAVPFMKGRPGAAILNISSTNGIDSLSPESADYDTSKAGVISLTRNLAHSLAPDIRVNSVAPGWIDTEINKDLPKDFVQSEIKKIALKRWGRPEEIAAAVLFLCSDEASFVTGSTLIVDGGYE